jgi:hypothetical protein
MRVPTGRRVLAGADVRRWGLAVLALVVLGTTARANLALAYASPELNGGEAGGAGGKSPIWGWVSAGCPWPTPVHSVTADAGAIQGEMPDDRGQWSH